MRVSGSDPYPWPYEGGLTGSRLALVLSGWQHHWAANSVGVSSVESHLAAASDAVASSGGWIVDLRHGSLTGASRFLPRCGSPSWASYWTRPTTLTVDASGFDGCFGSSLELELRKAGRDQIVIGGFAAELTVDSTMRSLNDRGFECLVLSDGCAPVDPLLLERALHSTTMSGGIFGAVGSTRALLDALEELRS